MANVEVLAGTLQAGPSNIAAALELLDPAELDRAASFRFARHRRRFVIRRARLREVLARECGCDPRDLKFDTNAYGKPVLAGAGIHFSASHSDELWLVALGERPLGADCEKITPIADWREVAASLFGRTEIEALNAQEPGLAVRAFFDCWARKEAFVKALGFGLSYPLDAFEVNVTPEPQILSGGKGWRIAALSLGQDYAGAVVIEDDGTPLAVRLHCAGSINPALARAA